MRMLQIIGLPESAECILCKKYVDENGEELWVPKYSKRLRGYTVSLFYTDRVPLYEYVDEQLPPLKSDEYGNELSEPFSVKIIYYEELQAAPWSSGPNAYLRLVEASTGKVVAEWPTTDGFIDGS